MLFNEFQALYPNKNLVEDGIANVDKFNKTSPKILWILKEAVDEDKTSWSLCEFMNETVTSYPKWHKTWTLIIKISYALINNISEYKKIPNADKIEKITSNISLINIKKEAGISKSKQKEINKYYLQTKYFLLKQIVDIKPNIIFNCSGVSRLLNDLKSKTKAIIINVYHPAQRRLTHKQYFDLCVSKCIKS